MTDTNLTPEQLQQEQQYKAILDKTTYTLTYPQYQELERMAALYESLHTFLQSFESDSPISNVSCLFDYINGSFFEYIETLKPNEIT